MRDFAQIKGDGTITATSPSARCACSTSTPEGFDAIDRRLLSIIIEHFDGGPVGVESLAAALSEERGTIEDVLEPFLIQQGFLMRTARGRVATSKAYRHLGLKPPKRPVADDLFDATGTGT